MDAEEQRLRSRLRQAAQSHTPDRERMLARVEHGMRESTARPSPTRPARRPVGPPVRRSWLRAAAASVAVAGVLVVGGYGVVAAVRGGAPGQPTVSTSSGGETPRTSADAELLWADGSVDPGSSTYWSQSNVTVQPKRSLAALTVELRLDARGAPHSTGHWRSLRADDFAVSVRTDRGDLVYRWTLRPGRTVPAGTHVFAAQYDHAQGRRDAHGDTYTIRARAAEPTQRDVWKGDFA